MAKLSVGVSNVGKGFSLIEVMMALFLISLVIGVSSSLAGNALRNANELTDTTMARWVALNQITEAQLMSPLKTGKADGKETMGQVEWRWQREIQPSQDESLLEINVQVFRAEGRSEMPVASVKGYRATPLPVVTN